jgi:hypothetical protein
MVLEPASLLREGSGTATGPRLQTPPLHLGGLQRCHMPRGSRLRCTIWEGSDAARHPSAPDLTSSLKRGPALARVLRLQIAPTSDVGSGADTCPVALHRLWAVETKEGIAAMACNKAHVFSRHAHALPRCLQYVQADGVIMTCKPCGQTLQHHDTVHHRVADHSQAWCYSTVPCS